MIKSGELIESRREMTPEYLRELKHTLIVSGDTELISAPAYYLAAKRAPSINAFMTGIAIIQDELAHAHIAYHILEELGEDQEKLIFSRDPKSFRYPYAFDVPLAPLTQTTAQLVPLTVAPLDGDVRATRSVPVGFDTTTLRVAVADPPAESVTVSVSV